MNKKQRILTVVALGVFGAVIFLHYSGIGYERKHNYTYVGNEADEAEWIVAHHGKILKTTALPAQWEKRDYNAQWRLIDVEWPGYFYLADALIPDLRVPIFALAVFYTGLFFMLGHQKSRA